MAEQLGNPEQHEQQSHQVGDVINCLLPDMPGRLKVIVSDAPELVQAANVKVDEDGRYKAGGIGGMKKPFGYELIDHLDREQLLDALARSAGPDGSDGFNTFREAITESLEV